MRDEKGAPIACKLFLARNWTAVALDLRQMVSCPVQWDNTKERVTGLVPAGGFTALAGGALHVQLKEARSFSPSPFGFGAPKEAPSSSSSSPANGAAAVPPRSPASPAAAAAVVAGGREAVAVHRVAVVVPSRVWSAAEKGRKAQSVEVRCRLPPALLQGCLVPPVSAACDA
jgi:hypothetical protein